MPSDFAIAGRTLGERQPCFIIAEAGVNHDGLIERALDLIDAAAAAGADAVKFQTFDADRLVTKDAPKAAYQRSATDAAETQHAMLKRLELSRDQHVTLMRRCDERGVAFLSTPFDEQSADLLEDLGIAAFKTPSGELTNLPYLRHVAAYGKPMIVSTGMATLDEVAEAVASIRETNDIALALLHCVSSYPADPSTVNLRAMETMRAAFDVLAGYSDHTPGIDVAMASVALGARVLEKHITLDRTLPGPDHQASLEPDDFTAMVRGIRTIESAFGNGDKIPTVKERETAAVARKSLAAASDVAAGDVLTSAHVVAMRPGTGLAPKERARLIGRKARVAIPAGVLIDWQMLE
jgi:N,N'-diacetyllegionaminate synthase